MCAESCLQCWLRGRACDHTLLAVRAWLLSRGADPASVIPFLHEEGGFCTCEVVMNVFDGRRIVLDDLVLSCGRDLLYRG